jgi:DNA-binding winged helix-turn-helix (wHTH) protein
MSDEDNLCYLIENKIMFIPDKQTLVHADSHEQIKLKPTASLCLLLLLNHHGTVVTQNELLAFGWGENHRQVSFNAFYQSILSLRKAFLQMGMEKQIITTLPRRGLIVQQEITLEKLPYVSTESTQTALQPEEPVLAMPAEVVVAKSPRLNIVEIIIIALTVLLSGILLYPDSPHADYFSDYVPALKKYGECEVFFNGNASNYIRHDQFISQHLALCEGEDSLYITAYPETKSVSVLLCSLPVDTHEDNTCRSVFYPRYDSK